MGLDTIEEIGQLRYKAGLVKALSIIMSHRHKCLDNATQMLYGDIIKDIQKEMDKIVG